MSISVAFRGFLRLHRLSIPQRLSSFKTSEDVGDLSKYNVEYETTSDANEWKHVERILGNAVIPKPSVKDVYPSGWRAPKPREMEYMVQRNANHMLPVYLKLETMRQQRRLTHIRRISGDIWKLEDELRRFLEEKHNKLMIPSQINELYGSIIFKGDYVNSVKQWLYNKGF